MSQVSKQTQLHSANVDLDTVLPSHPEVDEQILVNDIRTDAQVEVDSTLQTKQIDLLCNAQTFSRDLSVHRETKTTSSVSQKKSAKESAAIEKLIHNPANNVDPIAKIITWIAALLKKLEVSLIKAFRKFSPLRRNRIVQNEEKDRLETQSKFAIELQLSKKKKKQSLEGLTHSFADDEK